MLAQILLRRLSEYVSLDALEKDGGKTYMVKVQRDLGNNESQGTLFENALLCLSCRHSS